MAHDLSPEELAALEPIKSPCVLICSMDRETDQCFGCGRSRDEIARWTLISDEERDAVMAELPERMLPLREKLAERRARRRVNRRKRT